MVSTWGAGAVTAQLERSSRPVFSFVGVAVTVKAPSLGEASSPVPRALQRTVEGPVSAGCRPSCTVVVRPAGTVTPPLGLENPTAGNRPVPNDGGLSAAADPHEGSGAAESP